MRLIDIDGHGLELGVVDYQFPDSPVPGHRQSWLVIKGAARSAEGSWSFQWQALTASDAQDLAQWLRSAADLAVGISSGIDFTEPNLAFSASPDSDREIELLLSFDLEFTPPWQRQTSAGSPFTIPCRVTRDALLQASEDWTAEIAPYPPWNPTEQ